MRLSLRSIAALAAVAGVIFACGSSDESTFTNTDGNDAGVIAPPPGTFIPNDNDGSVGPGTCTPKTCADLGANCGPIGDGCGGIVQCGACSGSETCGGGGTPSVCGKPACTPLSCTAIGADCGQQADGCGGIINCWPNDAGACPNAGDFCGGGGPSKCGSGILSDGGLSDGGVACVPKTCTDLGANCGMQADGCGNLINCGKFATPDGCDNANGYTCGGAGTPNQCGKACKPITSCPAGQNCGAVADGCGGIVSCYPAGTSSCEAGTCGGSGTPNVCGSSATCTGLCTQQVTCDSGTTSISGTVTTPNGSLPIYGALVYVPTTTPSAFTTGVTCEQCSSVSALVSATTGPDGKFLLANMPVSSSAVGKVMDIPVVVQLGRWRKQITVQTTACNNVTIPTVNAASSGTFVGGAARPSPDKVSAALPRNKNEGDIPLTAISTGQVDGLECVFRKIGIDDAEFTDPSGNGRIRFYQDNGAVITAAAGQCSISGASCGPGVAGNNVNYGSNCASTCSGSGRSCTTIGGTCSNRCSSNGQSCSTVGASCNGGAGTCQAGGTCTSNGVCTQTAGTPPASTLYNDPNELAKYDMTLFECVGSRVDKTTTQQANVRDYANKGGRVYATHFSYVWLYNAGASPWNTTASWVPDTNSWNSAIASLDTSFSKGVAFAQWLNIVGGLNTALPAGWPSGAAFTPKITINEARHDVDFPATAPAQRWLYTTTTDSPNIESMQHYTFNTDWTKPANQQCGRVLYSDFHVTTGSNTTNVVFPNECNNNALSTQEKVLAFMLFDLASCVSQAPPPATCTPLTCAQQGVQCGQTGDGCGNVITCPNCPAGQTCGGGGTPNVCGASTCTPLKCQTGQCGKMGDGCGGTLDCGTCATGTCGGGGTANQCGMGTCTPTTCPTPANGSQCGPVADGCGNLLSCSCPAGYSCINGKCATSTCTPRTCAQAGANCGQLADGCGGILDCGQCLAPQTCGGGGTPNVCGGGVN